MTRQQTIERLEAFERAFGQRDLTAMMTPYAEDCVVESRLAGTVTGAAAIAQVFLAWFSAFPDATQSTDEVLVDGDRIVWLVTMTGSDTGGFMGLPPTGKAFRLPMVFILTLKNDKVVHERRIYDFTGMLIQIGVFKTRPI